MVVVEIEEKEEGFVGNDLISKMNIEEREEKWKKIKKQMLDCVEKQIRKIDKKKCYKA